MSGQSPPPSSGFAVLVDEYLEQFALRHPSIAAGNGIHSHDDELEDFSAAAIASEVPWLRDFQSRLDGVEERALSADERVDRRILSGVVDGWLLDLDGVRTWTRNPMIYASAISDGVHNLMTMESSPAEERMRQAASKLEPAARVDPAKDPLEVWRSVLSDHPGRGKLVAAAQQTVDELFAFIREKRLVAIPEGERVVVALAPAFDLGIASMHSSPPLEAHPVKSFYYVTDASSDWPPERQDAWLQKFNFATLADISAHEVAPGHYLHSLYMRRTPGKIRRIWIGLNPFPQPSSGQDGWAHYAEQMVNDEGFHQGDPRYKLAQVSEALTRICRLIAGLRLHSGEWTVEDAQALFEREAHLPAPAARQEAVRGTYDPTYGGYFLGKLAALKLRRDYEALRGDGFDLREFHERVMTNGIAPWWAHRKLLLPGDTGPVIE